MIKREYKCSFLSINENTFLLAVLIIQNRITTKFQTITQLSHQLQLPTSTGFFVFRQLVPWVTGIPGHTIFTLTDVGTSISTCAGVHLWKQLSRDSFQCINFRKRYRVQGRKKVQGELAPLGFSHKDRKASGKPFSTFTSMSNPKKCFPFCDLNKSEHGSGPKKK